MARQKKQIQKKKNKLLKIDNAKDKKNKNAQKTRLAKKQS